MRRHPLKEILRSARPYWDTESARPEVRHAFNQTIKCGTAALGSEVYASEKQRRIVHHTCKSRACASCGHMATIQWQRERWAALPSGKYKAITFTMPRELWDIFRDNRPLCTALPALAANALQVLAANRKGVRVGTVAIPHTFNSRLDFNAHVHVMTTAGGLHRPTGAWVPSFYYPRDDVMHLWRQAVIGLLRAAVRSGALQMSQTAEALELLLNVQEGRPWIVRIQNIKSKEHYLRYAARYARRPPIAQRRIIRIGKNSVSYWAKDKKSGSRVTLECSLEEFVKRWQQHIPSYYEHAVRSFGLFSSRFGGQNTEKMFVILGEKRRPQPRRRRWSDTILRDFGIDPLLDANGGKMKWVGRIAPQALR